MATTGNNLAGAGATVARGTNTDWTTPGNITADDASTASAAVPTDYLVASSFGFSVPTGSAIKGVTVTVEAHETGSGTSNYIPQLISATTPTLIGSAKTAVTVSGATPTISTNGSGTDLWGASLTPAIVNATGFGVAIWSDDTTNTLLVDYIKIQVTYDPPISGALAATESGSDTASMAGDVIVKGSLAVTSTGTDTAALTGDVLIDGALAATESGSDTAAFEGTVSSTTTLYYVIYAAALSAPSAAQVKAGQDANGDPAVASGNEPSPGASTTYTFSSPATGLTAATSYRVAIVWSDGALDSNVAVSDAWATANTGTLAATETGSDAAALTGDVFVRGTLAVTETGSDTAAFTGDVLVTGAIVATESGADTAALTGDVLVTGALAATETGADTAYFTGDASSTIFGALAATETGSDAAAFTGDVLISGSIDAFEGEVEDAAAITGQVRVQGALAATESGADTALFTGIASNTITGALAATETGADTAAFTGDVLVQGTVAATEAGADAAAITGTVLVQGALDAAETGDDSAYFSSSPVEPAHTVGGGGSRAHVLRRKEFEREVDDVVSRIEERLLREQIAREDEELVIIMAALAA